MRVIKKLIIVSVWLVLLVLHACDKGDDKNDSAQSHVELGMQFEPDSGRSFLINITVNATGFSPQLADLSLLSEFGLMGDMVVMATEPFTVTVKLTPPELDDAEIWTGEIPITARYRRLSLGVDSQITRTALILAQRISGLGQPESVPGLVNTLGVEDSPQVSPDGQWLIVGTYIPIDLGYCLVGGGGYLETACNANFFKSDQIIRPGMFGADRILSATEINHSVTQLNYDPTVIPAGVPSATPPTSSFGFRRLGDGSFGEPFVLGVDFGGYTWNATNGFSFDTVSDSVSRIFYSFNDPGDSDGATDIYFVDMQLGKSGIFGVYDQGVLKNFTSTKVPIVDTTCGDIICHAGNPHITAERLWFDNAPVSEKSMLTNDLFYVDVTRDGSGYPTEFTGRTKVPVSRDDRGESMPFMDGNLLYYQCDTSLCRTPLLEPGDPSKAASWGAEQTLMTASALDWQQNLGRNGRVVAVTEPSIAVIEENGNSQKWLYFGYILQNHYGAGAGDFGANWNVARVKLEN